MPRPTTKENELLPPYPRLGECYRLLANALDTKNSNREVDRLAREGDFDWQVIPDLQQRLIKAPLRDKSSEAFANYVMATVEVMHDEYIHMIKKVAVDAMTRSETLPVLIRHQYAPRAASFLLKLSDAIPSPSLVQMLDSDRHPIDVVFDWLEEKLTVNKGQLGYVLYPDSTGQNKNGREDLKRWRQGIQLPSLARISLISQELREQLQSHAHLIGACTEWLITARALAFFEEQATPYLDLRRTILREVLCGAPPVDLGWILSNLNIEAGNRLQAIKEAGLYLSEDLRRKAAKQPGDMTRTRAALEHFRQLLADGDTQGICTYYLEWLMGRWYVLAGQPVAALQHYERAVDLSLYRSGETQRNILKEALILAANLRKLPLYKRLKHRALVFDLAILPPHEDVVADREELRLIGDNFDLWFPEWARFVEAGLSLH